MTVSGQFLKKLRKMAHLTQAELAKNCGVHKSLVSRWERDKRMPSPENLFSIATALGVSIDYLLNAELDIHFTFRSKATLSKEQKKAIDTVLKDAEIQLHYLHQAYKMKSKIAPRFMLHYELSHPQLPEMAKSVRNELKLNKRITLEELKQSLAEKNIHIYEWAMPYDVSGFSYRNAYTAIFINRLHTKERRLFTLAHEVGHVLFHLKHKEKETIVSVISSNRDPKEKEANAFAAELLMPQHLIKELISEYGDKLKEKSVLRIISRSLNVSQDALFYRLTENGVFKWYEKNEYLKKPEIPINIPSVRVKDIDNQIDPEFVQIAMELYENEKISAGKLTEWFFTDRKTIEEYLSEYFRPPESILEFSS